MSVLPARHVVTVEEYDRMVEAGVFAADRRLELIGGEIVDMSPIGSAHEACVDRLTRSFAPLATSDRAALRIQGSFQADDRSRPQPDVAILRTRGDFYAEAHPRPEDLFLVVEVADSSLRYDRSVKRPAYARVGVRETWIVDLVGGIVEVARDPSAAGYCRIDRFARGETVAPEAFPDLTIAVDDVLG
jgi:Uma2 family endonuclease